MSAAGRPSVTLTARLAHSAADARRGVVRLHPEILDALGLRPWEAVRLTGSRVTAALAAAVPDGRWAAGTAALDDLTLSNAGLTDGAEVVVEPVAVAPARMVLLAESRLATGSVTPETLRLALLGKVLTAADAVSLLPQDLAPPPGADVPAARHRLASAIGLTWTNELLTVARTEPAGAVAVQPSTVVGWRDGPRTGALGDARGWSYQGGRAATGAPGDARTGSEQAIAPAVADLVGHAEQARRLSEWLELAFRRPELLVRLGAAPRLGVLLSGPEGVGKSTLVRATAAAAGADVIELTAPSVAATEPTAAARLVQDALAAARAAPAGRPSVLLVSDVEALLPATDPPPLATVVLDVLRAAVASPGVALVATTAHPAAVDPRLRDPELVDRELSLPLPDGRTRAELLRRLLRDVPCEPDVDVVALAERTPGFVVADLVALRREAAVRAALRHVHGEPAGSGPDADEPRLAQADLLGALATVRPVSMSASEVLATGGLSLVDVGDMAATKQALTEAVLWPLRYPDSFARLGVAPPHGVLLYGPPGCGKTFLVRALAGTGALNVFAVKGAELLDKWVGESERAVRELFRRAADANPSLVFLDEVDALAPRRGQSADSGVSDRMVAALLTELDGVEPLREVVVVAATNRPELLDPALLRPGRLERLVYVPPPDASARAEILQAAARNTPLAPEVSLAELAVELAGYSAADCAALVREAALTAMRESMAANVVSAEHLAAARASVRASLDPEQLAALEAFATHRRT